MPGLKRINEIRGLVVNPKNPVGDPARFEEPFVARIQTKGGQERIPLSDRKKERYDKMELAYQQYYENGDDTLLKELGIFS